MLFNKKCISYVILICILNMLCVGCTQNTVSHDFAIDSTKRVLESDVEKEPDNIYHWAIPSVFEDIQPIISEQTDNDSFMTEYKLPDTWSSAIDCFSFHSVIDDKNLIHGTYYQDSNNNIQKICTIADCRDNTNEICEHLTSQENPHCAVWYEDYCYYIGSTLERPSGHTIKWFILRWKNGSSSYEKIFESDRVLSGIYFHKGIMYVYSPRNFKGDISLYYAVNVSEKVYTEIEVGSETYQFCKDSIVRIDAAGTYFTDSLLNPIEQCYLGKYLGQVDGEFYYYLEDAVLYHTERGMHGKAQKLMNNVANFSVCDGLVFYMPYVEKEAEVLFYFTDYEFVDGTIKITNEKEPFIGYKNREILCAEIDSTGQIKNKHVAYKSRNNEWVTIFQSDYNHGRAVQIITVCPGDGEYIQYYQNYYLINMDNVMTLGSYISRIDVNRIK